MLAHKSLQAGMEKTVGTLIKALRVYQWSKNLLVFAGLVFAQQFLIPGQIFRSLLAFVAFCGASSAMYLFNDLIDIESDRVHPEKRNRPIASGTLSIRAAIGAILVLLALSLGISGTLGFHFLLIVCFYLGLTTFYTLELKKIVIVDVLAVAIGFVVRAIAGAIALEVTFSNWLVVCTLFLALFLGISKRRHEIHSLNDDAISHREVLGHYTVPYLDAINIIVAGAALITYTIYTCSPEVAGRLGTDKLYLTLPFVVYGLFRYMYLVHHNLDGGDPSSTLIKDRPLSITVVLWGISCVALIYWKALFA